MRGGSGHWQSSSDATSSAGVALAASISYRRFVKTLPSQDVSSGYLIGLGSLINVVVAAAGIALAVYLLVGGLPAA